MSKFYIMVTDHRIAVGESDSYDGIMEVYDRLSEFDGYKGKMKILREFGHGEHGSDKAHAYPFPDLDSIIDEETDIGDRES